MYSIANGEERDTSFIGTLASGFAGVAMGIAIAQAADQRGEGSTMPLFLPLTFFNSLC